MLTDQLLEFWNIDAPQVIAHVDALIGPCDIFFGGSLADDLGTVGSDIDLYCFMEGGQNDAIHPLVADCGGTALELHIVDVTAAAKGADDLSRLLIGEPPPPHQWPLLSPQQLRQAHALYQDRALRRTGLADRLRRATGADILHLYVALRAALTCASLVEDVSLVDSADGQWAALYCSRLAAESALEAALAAKDYVNPNAKWRIALAERARLTDQSFPASDAVRVGLFPDSNDITSAIRTSLIFAHTCISVVGQDGVLASFPIVEQASDLLLRTIEESQKPSAHV